MDRSLEGKVALVTGASAGIGRGIAESLIQAGAQVFGTGRNLSALERVAAGLGPGFVPVEADSSKAGDLDTVMETVAATSGRLDIVVANAGSSEVAALGAITDAHLDRVIDLNFRGTIFTVQKALPLLRDGGSILLMSSIMAFRGHAGISVYSATKAAIRSLARGWLVELQDRRIRVNVITPGAIETEGMHAMMPNKDAARRMIEGLAATIPVGRIGQPCDIGELAVFLSSPAATFINGADIQIDGGAAQI